MTTFLFSQHAPIKFWEFYWALRPGFIEGKWALFLEKNSSDYQFLGLFEDFKECFQKGQIVVHWITAAELSHSLSGPKIDSLQLQIQTGYEIFQTRPGFEDWVGIYPTWSALQKKFITNSSRLVKVDLQKKEVYFTDSPNRSRRVIGSFRIL